VSGPRGTGLLGRLTLALACCAAVAVSGSAAPAQAKRYTVLATGDSMIQILDGFLKQRLSRPGRVRVLSDARISTGLSKPLLLNWPGLAKRQVNRFRPRATVVFIGANDGFPMRNPAGRDVACCGRGWVVEYARRARGMMRTYLFSGRGRVYWLLLPQARGGFFRRIFPAVNAALRRAARPLGRRVRLIRLNRVFTPGGRFRASIDWHGHRVNVRQQDGVHLSVQGASIAASYVIRRMRGDHVLSQPKKRQKSRRRRRH
jgi:hypothetical protein